jgi:hypothetical protein
MRTPSDGYAHSRAPRQPASPPGIWLAHSTSGAALAKEPFDLFGASVEVLQQLPVARVYGHLSGR